MQRLARIGLGNGFLCVTSALLATLAVSLRYAPDLRAGGLINPDSYMRLVRLREMLNQGTVLDVVARDGSGHGTDVYWTHLIDSLLCLIAAPLGLVLPPDDALHAAALLFGPLNMAALAFAVIWAAAPFAERKWLWLGAILPALSPAIASYGLMGVVHHHVAIAVAAVACWGWSARIVTGLARPSAGIALGTWAAVGLWFTPECVPLTMMAFGGLWVAWFAYPARGDIPRAIVVTGLSFAIVTTLALLVDPPASGAGAMDIDRLDFLFAGLALAVAGTALGTLAVHREIAARGPRLAVAAAIGLLCCAIWAVTCRGALVSTLVSIDDAQREAFFGHDNEMLPVGGVLPTLQFLLTGACAALIAIASAARRRSLPLSYAAACLCGLVILGWTHARFAAYPEAAGAVALPIALTMATRATARWHQIGQSFVRMATILMFVQMPYLGQFPDLIGSARAQVTFAVPACRVSDAVAMLASHPGAVVLADVNDTPELLYRTNVRTVGSLYHRGIAGFMRMRAAWRVAPANTVPPEIDAAGISLVLGCGTPLRSAMVDDIRTATLLDQVRTGHPPSWLTQIDENPVSGQVLYKVVHPVTPPANAMTAE